MAVVSLPARLFVPKSVSSLREKTYVGSGGRKQSLRANQHIVRQGVHQISLVPFSIWIVFGSKLRQKVFTIGELLFLIVALDLAFNVLAIADLG